MAMQVSDLKRLSFLRGVQNKYDRKVIVNQVRREKQAAYMIMAAIAFFGSTAFTVWIIIFIFNFLTGKA